MVANLIHQLWLQGAGNVPREYGRMVESWRRLNPQSEHRIWDEEQILRLFEEHCAHLVGLYRNYPYWIQKADLARYAVLCFHGGLYVDIDSECLRPIEPLLGEFSAEAALEGISTPGFWLGAVYERIRTGASPCPIEGLNNSFLYAPHPDHPLLTFLLRRLFQTAPKAALEPYKYYVSRSTGPIFLSRCIHECARFPEPPRYGIIPDRILRHYRRHTCHLTWLPRRARSAHAPSEESMDRQSGV